MVTSLAAYLALLALFVLERGAELVLSTRHARVALARGGVESGRGHYAFMVALHALFLISCAAEPIALGRPSPGAVALVPLAVVLLAQGLRWWAIATLGEQWNTRVIVVPDLEPATGGPYRFLRHPNYLAVVAEIACLPLVHGAWLTAVVFSVANALLLAVRVPCEEKALGPRWEQALAGRARDASS
jgi:methyltransferase